MTSQLDISVGQFSILWGFLFSSLMADRGDENADGSIACLQIKDSSSKRDRFVTYTTAMIKRMKSALLGVNNISLYS